MHGHGLSDSTIHGTAFAQTAFGEAIDWQYFLMKHGIGSPGYIARRMARQYRAIKEADPTTDEVSILFRIYSNRVVAQSVLGGPNEYQAAREDPSLIRATIEQNSSLFMIIRHAVFVEHPELSDPRAPSDRFQVLDRVLTEILDHEAPGWRAFSQGRQGPQGERPQSVRHERSPTTEIVAPHSTASTTGLRGGLSVEAALGLLLSACNKPDTLFITERWIGPRLQSLRGLLSEPISWDEAEALHDAVMRRTKLDDVIEWLKQSTLSWRVFRQRNEETIAEMKKIKAAEDRLLYERKFAEAERAWKTKASTPWEAAMGDKTFQAGHDPSAAKQRYGGSAHPCPRCGTRDLTWFYFVTPLPRYELRQFHGFAGWMTACERCNVTVDFFQEMRVYY